MSAEDLKALARGVRDAEVQLDHIEGLFCEGVIGEAAVRQAWAELEEARARFVEAFRINNLGPSPECLTAGSQMARPA
jgi:hypothetical protein